MRFFALIAFFGSIGISGAALGETTMSLKVTPVTTQRVSSLYVTDEQGAQIDGSVDTIPLVIDLPKGGLDAPPHDMTLHLDFGAQNDSAYIDLVVRASSPPSFPLKFFHEDIDSTFNNVQNIEQNFLEAHDQSTFLSVFFRARAAYESRAKTNRYHVLAIRAAYIWFEASVDLAKSKNSIFRLDEAALNVMEDFESRATSNEQFQQLYRGIVRQGEVDKLKVQVAGLQLKSVDDQASSKQAAYSPLEFKEATLVVALLRKGKIEDAKKLNDRLLTAFQALNHDSQNLVTTNYRVDENLFLNNQKYIQQLLSEE